MNSLLKLQWLVLFGSLVLQSRLTHAQTDTTKFICYFPIEPMQELASGGGNKGIQSAIRQRLIYPPEALRAQVEGRVFLTFTVAPTGEVKQVVVVKSLWAPFDSAAVNAVQQLPCFKPRSEKYGAVRYTVPITFQVYEDYPAKRKAARHRNSTP